METQTKQELDNIMLHLRDFIDDKDMDSKSFDLLIEAQDNIRKARDLLFKEKK